MMGLQNTELSEKKRDADSLINEVLKKIPEEKKIEVLRILDGFVLGVETNKKAG